MAAVVTSSNDLPVWQRLANYMQKGDTIGAEIGVYAISGILFTVAYHKIRPITKFGKPSDIPAHFVQQRLKQIGRVTAVQPSAGGPLLRVSHRPPLDVFIGSKKTLPVKILGVSINPNGYAWLQTVAVNNSVKFVPLLTQSSADYAVCQVFLDNKSRQLPVLDLATCLTSLGFAQVTDIPRPLADDPLLVQYFAGLLAAQKRAQRQRAGQWSQILPAPIWPIGQLQALTNNAIHSVTPVKWRLPELVR